MAGIDNGQIIKIAKAGDAGPRGAEPGDLYVQIAVAPHPLFERRTHDLAIKKEISLIDLLLNKKIDVVSVGGDSYSFELPPDVAASEEVRILGAGMTKLGSRTRGDLYVKLIIKKPKRLSVEAKKLLEDLKRELE